MTIRSINYATAIQFGAGAIARLTVTLAARQVMRPMLLSDQGVVNAGLVERVIRSNPGLSCTIVDNLPAHPNEEYAREVAGHMIQSGSDGIVAIGGGSVCDFAKAVRIIAADPAPLREYVSADHPRPYPRTQCPLVVVPTTAGTGSEISRGLPIWSGGKRLVLLSPTLFPTEVLADPEMTVSLPLPISLATGFDAMAHCIEGYLSPFAGPPYAVVALSGAARLARALTQLTEDPTRVEIRAEVMMGGIEGGISMPLGLGAVHGLGIPLDEYGVHHGAIITALLAPGLRAYGKAIAAPARDLASAMGFSAEVPLSEGVEALARRLGLAITVPITLTDDVRETLISDAMASFYHTASPLALDREAYRGMLSEALANGMVG